MAAKACIVTTLKDVSWEIVDTFIAHHLRIGFCHIFMFYDAEETPQDFPSQMRKEITLLTQGDVLNRLWRESDEYVFQKSFTDSEVMARQVLNVSVAIKLAIQAAYDWILHIDIDELFVLNESADAGSHYDALTASGLMQIYYLNHEAIPETMISENYFKETTLFKKNFRQMSDRQKEILLSKIISKANYFRFYNDGKSAARLTDGLRPDGVHRFNPGSGSVCGNDGFVLHFACCGLNEFRKKYQLLGNFDNKWFGEIDIAGRLPFHILSRNVVQSNDDIMVKNFYEAAFLNQILNEREYYLNNGILFRANPSIQDYAGH